MQKLTLETIGVCGLGFDPEDSSQTKKFLQKAKATFDFVDDKMSMVKKLANLRGNKTGY